MVIAKENVFTCVIYAAYLYQQIEIDIPNFFMTLFLLWFGKGYNTHIVSSDWSDSNEYFSIWGR